MFSTTKSEAQGKFSPAFFQKAAPSNARSVGRASQGAKSSLWRLLFCQALLFFGKTRTPCLQGARSANWLYGRLTSRRKCCASDAKEKSGHRIQLAFVEKGEPPTCAVPLCQAAAWHSPLCGASNDKGISPSAEVDQGFAFGNHKLLKKLEQNF